VFDNVEHAPHIVGPPSDETAAMARSMSRSWLAFARTGDPENDAIPAWPPYDLTTRSVLHLDVAPAVVDDPFREERLTFERYESQQARGGVLHRTVSPD
jgi:para-nitrobenzyl esterase